MCSMNDRKSARFEVLTLMLLKNPVLWDVTLWHLAVVH
jgi:hypothetical protein